MWLRRALLPGVGTVCEADSGRFLAIDHSAREEELGRERWPDQSGQNPGRAHAGVDSNSREIQAQLCLCGYETEIAGQGDAEPGSDCMAIDGGKRRAGHVPNR